MPASGGFSARVIRRELHGIDRKIHAAENSLSSAQWAFDRAEEAVIAQTANLEVARKVLEQMEANLNALLEEKEDSQYRLPNLD